MRITTLGPALDRITKRFRVNGECWEYTGRTVQGYGAIEGDEKGNILVHRISAAVFGVEGVGPYVLHSCDNTRCFNPEHLRYGTQQENSQDSVKRGRHVGATKKAHCPQGHPYSGRNLSLKKKNGKTYNSCRSCAARYWRKTDGVR
jgi:hypothetical protein